MSFLDLPREARNLIYDALLCPPDGVYLQSDAHSWAWASSNRYGDSEEDEEEDDDSTDISQREKRSPTASAAIPVSTAIFYVSHLIQQEASQVFQGFNRFTYESAYTALEYLENPRPSFRHYIKDLAFTRRSTCADDGDPTQIWEPLCEFINRHMLLKSVTIQVPRDRSYGTDKIKEAREAPDSEWYYWPALGF